MYIQDKGMFHDCTSTVGLTSVPTADILHGYTFCGMSLVLHCYFTASYICRGYPSQFCSKYNYEPPKKELPSTFEGREQCNKVEFT